MADTLLIPKVYLPTSVQTDLRLISLTPTVSKQLESIVGEWILLHVRDQLDPSQYGSLKSRSTADALIDKLHHWSSALASLHMFCSSTLPRRLIGLITAMVLQKLRNYGVPKFVIDSFASLSHVASKELILQMSILIG